MEKVFLLKGLNCPNCAAKIQRKVEALEGIESATLDLMKGTLTLSLEPALEHTIGETVTEIVHSHEPHVEVSEKQEELPREEPEEDDGKKMILRLAIGGMIFVAGLLIKGVCPLPVYLAVLIVSYILLGGDVVLHALKNIVRGRVFDEHFLMSLSTLGAFVIGEYPEAVAVMLFYQVGEFFQDRAVSRSRKSIAELMDLRPDSANVLRHGQLMTVSPETVCVGEKILVKAGEKIPLDGIILEGSSMLDTSALTGESVPRAVHPGDEALSGCINESGSLTIEVKKEFGQSTVSKIIDLVENASSRKAPTENFITTFARYYTPVVVILAALLGVIPPLLFGGVWTDWIHRAFVFLVISCPCALVISIPLTFFGGIGAASRHGVLVKGSNYLEALNNVDTVVFDKTGTLTKGVFRVTEILPEPGFTEEQVLEYAAKAERLSNHPIAKSILAAFRGSVDGMVPEEHREIPGHGVSLVAAGETILAGNETLMETEGISFRPWDRIGTKVYVAVNGEFAGCILVSDELKADSKEALVRLKKLGVRKTVMLTGDDEKIAGAVAKELGMDDYRARLLPQDKVAVLEDLESSAGGKLAFVGDGINDAPVLARADVGIAMGGLGSDAAIEAADIVLMTDEPGKLVEAMEVAKATRRIVIQNIVIALTIKALFLVLGAFGIAGMWEAVFGDVGVALIAVFNAMRMLKK